MIYEWCFLLQFWFLCKGWELSLQCGWRRGNAFLFDPPWSKYVISYILHIILYIIYYIIYYIIIYYISSMIKVCNIILPTHPLWIWMIKVYSMIKVCDIILPNHPFWIWMAKWGELYKRSSSIVRELFKILWGCTSRISNLQRPHLHPWLLSLSA